jgi:ribonuclease HI
MKSEHRNKIIVFTDGGSRGNPGPAALGVYFESLGKKYGEFLGQATNNVAEYEAIIFSLKKAKQLIGKKNADKTEIEIKSDSQLVVSQLSGEFKLKEKSLWKYFIRIWNLKQDFKKVSFSYIPREKNKIADAMLNEILDSHARRGLF